MICAVQNASIRILPDAPIAHDLQRKIYQMIVEGHSDDEIVDYLIERYGTFITYSPPFNSKTFMLWIMPVIFILIGLSAIVFLVRRNNQNAVTADKSGSLLSEEEKTELNTLLGEEAKNTRNGSSNKADKDSQS